MTERPDRHEKLLAETFHDDWTAGDFARRAAAHARGRKQRRRALLTTAALAAGLALAVLPRFAPVQTAPLATGAAEIPSGYEIISDEELLAQLRDRPVLSIQNDDGTQDIVLLSAENSPASTL